MKRQIKFRGQRIDNGEWVYGYLIHENIIKNKITFINATKTPSECEINCYGFRVIPETIGQFTECFDKCCKEIYEGDILKVETGCGIHLTHVMFNMELGLWHRFSDYRRSKIIGNIHKNENL